MLKLINKKSLYDTWGIILSLLCALHCAALPLIALASPVASHFLEDAPIHIIIFIILMPISFFAFVKHRRAHEKLSPLILATCGLTLLFIGIITNTEHAHHGTYTSAEIFSIIGSVFLIVAHGINLKHLSACNTCSH